MNHYSIIQIFHEDPQFVLFEKVLNKIYPEQALPLKKIEGINFQFFHKAYIILQNEEAIGRCILYANPHLNYNNKKTACIGNFECLNDKQASYELFNYVIKQAKDLGFEYIVGPMNGSTWDTYRLADTYDTPVFFLEPYYPNYYSDLLISSGFQKIARYVSNCDDKHELLENRISAVEEQLTEQGVKFRNIDLENYDVELDKLYDFCMRSFQSNFLFTPIDKTTFKEKYQKLKPYIKPEYVILAEDEHQDLVGMVFCLENYYDKKEKGIIVKTIARIPSLKYRGMGNILATKFKKRALANGYKYILHAFMIETNASRVLSKHFSGEYMREYFLYGKEL